MDLSWAKIYSLIVLHLLVAGTWYPQQAQARPSTSNGTTLERRKQYGYLEFTNYGDKEYEKPVMMTAWMDASVIASAAVQYEWGNQWQGVINYYFGTRGCSNDGKQDEITTAFARAKEATWGPFTAWYYPNIVVYMHEMGGTGWFRPQCANDPELLLYQVADKGYAWNDYHLVLCERFWAQVKGGDAFGWQLRTIAEMIAYVEAQKEAGKDYTQDATLLWGTTGGTILKEMHRFASTRFVNSISPRYYGTQDFAPWPPNVVGFAENIGCGIFSDSKGWDAEWAVTSINNADSYRVASEAIYWSRVFKLPTGTFPKPPKVYDFNNANLTSELPKLKSENRIFDNFTFPSQTSFENILTELPTTVTEPAYTLTTAAPTWFCHSGSDVENQNPSPEDGGDWACTCSLGGSLYGTLELGQVPASLSVDGCPTTTTDLPFVRATTMTTAFAPSPTSPTLPVTSSVPAAPCHIQ